MNRIIFITILASIAVILFFPIDVNAACEIACCGVDGCTANWGITLTWSDLCFVGREQSWGSGCFPWQIGGECSISNQVYCRKNRCEDTSYDPSDHYCKVYKACGNGIWECWPAEAEGKWSVNTRECVQCSGRVKTWRYADTSGIYTTCDGDPTSDITDVCESACGASTECDEANDAVGVVVPGGVCNNCVFSAVTACSWQNDACGQSPCAATERHQTCGPAGCSGGVCTPGSTRCVADSACLPCEDTCTCACPDECSCPGGECRGGLVPCGRSCNDSCTQICECCPCTLCHLFVLFKRIVDFATVNIFFPLAVLMIVIGGVMFLTAGGDTGRISGAKKILTATLIGLIIIFLAWLIVNTIITFLTPAGSPFQQWHTINCPVL